MTVKPGFGVERLHLRQSADQLRSGFGTPKKRRKTGSFREYWLYPEKRFDCIVSRRSGVVLSLFLHRGNPFLGTEIFGANEDQVREMFSKPDLDGGGFTAVTGDYVGRWLSYDQGIGFDFNVSGKVETVSIFAPKRSAKAKKTASHRQPHEQQIAALRTH